MFPGSCRLFCTHLIVPLAAGETGEYTEHEFVIASHLADPMYISYWPALNYHGLTKQVPLTVYAATTEQTPTHEIQGVTYKFVTVTASKFFGYGPRAINRTHPVQIADRAKAIADAADHPTYCGGITELANALQTFTAQNDGALTDTLTEYLLRMGNGAAIKRIVYLADTLSLDLERRADLEDAFTTAYSKLDPTIEQDGTHSNQYRLKLNVDEDTLRTEVKSY